MCKGGLVRNPLYMLVRAGCCANETEPNGEIVAIHQRPILEDVTVSSVHMGGRRM